MHLGYKYTCFLGECRFYNNQSHWKNHFLIKSTHQPYSDKRMIWNNLNIHFLKTQFIKLKFIYEDH